ncbi:MAG: HDIG domain-containing protein [Gemmataceae bacterium]|nr:HDIG domain-containing protein [Gemmataceae bacterium]
MFGPLKKLHPRLGQWNGRTRSSRSDEPLLQRLWRKPVLLRLGAVWLTTLTVTALAYSWGPPFPYRIGERYPYDLRVRVDFKVVNQIEQINQKEVRRLEAAGQKPPAAMVEFFELGRRDVEERYPRGTILVQRGQTVTERQLSLLEEEHATWARHRGQKERVYRLIALFIIFALLTSLVVLYVIRFQTGLAQCLPTIVKVCALIALTIGLGMLLSRPPWHAVLIPLTVTALTLTIAYNPQFALLMSFSLTLAMTVALGTDLGQLLIMMGGQAGAVLLLRNVRTRTRLVRVAACAGLAYFVMTLAAGMLSRQTWSLMLSDAVRNFLWGTLAGFLLTGCLPLIERLFGIVTDISLLELADGSHPLLQELVRRAPGTYTHSITVATLAEAAAEAIGANPLLTRVGSYFHDIGKMLKPHYFVENQDGLNRHDALEPALSTLIIIGHVKDGLALAKQYNLPQPIIDFIAQHHGTTLVEYFYREAIRLQESAGNGNTILEPSFRYPGPKPQSRENGIVMLSDAVESASRALGEPTPGSLRKLVHDLLMKRLLDGQFEESGLTLTELHLIEESLCKSLTALFHARIKYPEARVQDRAG